MRELSGESGECTMYDMYRCKSSICETFLSALQFGGSSTHMWAVKKRVSSNLLVELVHCRLQLYLYHGCSHSFQRKCKGIDRECVF